MKHKNHKNEFTNNLTVFNSILDDLPLDHTSEKSLVKLKDNLGLKNFKFTILFSKEIGIYKFLAQWTTALKCKIYLSIINGQKAMLNYCEESAIIFFRVKYPCQFMGLSLLAD